LERDELMLVIKGSLTWT